MILIDGQFEDRPAVRHKEILWAMAQGIVMIGAASMGALRAAELYPFGMIGVGAIFRWYRRWPLAPDDAVAVQNGPAELGFLPLTDALIDLQATFADLARRNMISPELRRELVKIARQMNFRDRSLKQVLRRADLPEDEADRILAGMVHKKSQDAEHALKTAMGLVNSHKSQSASSFSITNTFIRDLEAGGIDPDLAYNYNKHRDVGG
ncbi:TfuA-like protein [Borborobacter arsenicus]|nr:TfuA-like protein [Pseudaminobacter arsenicus]